MIDKGDLYWADLHIHSALSPCADDEMTPWAIVDQARKAGLSIIALTDHNSVLNCPAIMECVASNDPFLIIPGMELQTREEIHLVCLFGTLGEALKWHHFVTSHLEKKPNRTEYFGNQLIFDHPEHCGGAETNLLLVSTDLCFEQVFTEIKKFNGWAIPAHIDRPSYSVLSSLGFLPPSLQLNVIEISHHYAETEFRKKFPEFAGFNLIQSSDAHHLSEIGQGRTGLCLPELSWEAFLKVLFQNY